MLKDSLNGLEAPKGRKFDQGKPRYSLLPSKALREVVRVLTFGSTKYEDFNWKHVDNFRDRYFSAGQRHQWDWMEGIILDDENKCHHLASAITNLMFILEMELEAKAEIEKNADKREGLVVKKLEEEPKSWPSLNFVDWCNKL